MIYGTDALLTSPTAAALDYQANDHTAYKTWVRSPHRPPRIPQV
jgi:hypothetical protein